MAPVLRIRDAQSTGAVLIGREEYPDGIEVTLLADGDHLEALARLGFLPIAVDDVSSIASELLLGSSTYASQLSGAIYTSSNTDELQQRISGQSF